MFTPMKTLRSSRNIQGTSARMSYGLPQSFENSRLVTLIGSSPEVS